MVCVRGVRKRVIVREVAAGCVCVGDNSVWVCFVGFRLMEDWLIHRWIGFDWSGRFDTWAGSEHVGSIHKRAPFRQSDFSSPVYKLLIRIARNTVCVCLHLHILSFKFAFGTAMTISCAWLLSDYWISHIHMLTRLPYWLIHRWIVFARSWNCDEWHASKCFMFMFRLHSGVGVLGSSELTPPMYGSIWWNWSHASSSEFIHDCQRKWTCKFNNSARWINSWS